MPVGFDNRHYTMKYRSRTQIITDILRAVNDSSTVGGEVLKRQR
jgi:predicted transcriptional regulator